MFILSIVILIVCANIDKYFPGITFFVIQKKKIFIIKGIVDLTRICFNFFLLLQTKRNANNFLKTKYTKSSNVGIC